jgi:oxaloacetate decarboxylase alpha subunit
MLNVITGERYKVVPDEVKRYAMGHYGEPPMPIDPAVLDRIISNGSAAISEKPDEPDAVVPMLRSKYPDVTDEERILRYLFEQHFVDEMLAAGPTRAGDGSFSITHPLVHLLEELARRPTVGRLYLRKGDDQLELVR